MNASSGKNNPKRSLKIADRLVGNDHPCFVIAEVGNNHNGDFDRAIALVDAAVAAGADCAKFQMRKLDEVYRASSLSGKDDDLAVEYTLDLLRRFELSTEQQRRVAAYCASKNIQYLCTPWDASSVATLETFGVQAYKVASADLTNLPLLAKLAATGKTLIVSTGMSTSDEIRAAAKFLDDRSAQYVLLHCQSTYPAALHNIHLRFMETLREIHPFVGYSGHERGIAVSIGAVAMGAILIERHITLDREMEGPDHAASLEPEEFKALVSGIREVEAARGEKLAERALSQGELINRENLAKSLVAARDIPSGTVVAESDVAVKSPGQGLSPLKMPALIGRRLNRAMARDDYFFQSDLADGAATARRYRFDRPWGVPVRYHDTQRFLEICQPDIIEFHLSYSDMERDPAAYLSGTYDLGFVVHAPELFAGSKLMDLATSDEALRPLFAGTDPGRHRHHAGLEEVLSQDQASRRSSPISAASPWTEPLSAERKAECYRIFAASLAELDLDGVELIPQTMAPFPWHFGGQRHQNIFIFRTSRPRSAPGMICGCASTSRTPSLPPIISASISPKASRSSARIPLISTLATPRVSTAKACR
jgi:N-acetylneuraminate synthase